MTLRTSLQMPWRRPTNSGIEVNGVKQLLLLDVLAFRVRDVNRAWPNKHGLAPVGEGRNVGRKFSDHGLDAGYRAEFHERDFENELGFGLARNDRRDPAAKFGSRADKADEQVGLSAVGDDIGSASA